jgi:hypothetical protein
MIKKWSYLIESDAKLRLLYKKWLGAGSPRYHDGEPDSLYTSLFGELSRYGMVEARSVIRRLNNAFAKMPDRIVNEIRFDRTQPSGDGWPAYGTGLRLATSDPEFQSDPEFPSGQFHFQPGEIGWWAHLVEIKDDGTIPVPVFQEFFGLSIYIHLYPDGRKHLLASNWYTPKRSSPSLISNDILGPIISKALLDFECRWDLGHGWNRAIPIRRG